MGRIKSIASMVSPHHLLLASATLSYAGGAVTNLVIASSFAALIKQTQSFSYFFVALCLPPILLRGVIVKILNRFDPRRLMIGLEVGRALLVGALAFIFASPTTGSAVIIILFLLTQATLSTFYVSAFYTSLPQLIGGENVDKYTSLSSSLTQIGYGIGAALFAASASSISPSSFLAIDSFSFLISASALALIALASGRNKNSNLRDSEGTKIEASIADTIPMLRRAGVTGLALLGALPVASLKLFNDLSSIIALRESPFGQRGYAAIDLAACLGAVLGGILIVINRGRRKLSNAMYCTVISLTLASLAVIAWNRDSILLAVASAFFFGLMYTILITVARASIYLFGGTAKAIREAITLINALESTAGLAFAFLVPQVVRSVSLSTGLIFVVSALYIVMIVYLHITNTVPSSSDRDHRARRREENENV